MSAAGNRAGKTISLLVALALFALPSRGQMHPAKPPQETQNQRWARILASPFPDQVGGWAKTGEPRSFDAANLWRYLDGDAEKYLQAGVESASTADYKLQNKVEAVADIYTMRDADGARKLFASEPARNAQPVSLGERARLYRQSLLFQSGRYLVRIVAYDELPKGSAGLVELGRGIQQRLPK
jgi:hypothetical protein